jgi:hypothetical protein
MRFSSEPDEGYPLTLPSPTRGEGKGTCRGLAPVADARIKSANDAFVSFSPCGEGGEMRFSIEPDECATGMIGDILDRRHG